MNKQILLVVGLVIGLAGCSSPRYSCPLQPGSPCRSMSEVWDGQTKSRSATSTTKTQTYAKNSEASKEMVAATDVGFQGEQTREPDGTPIYITGKPYMVWVPGSKDAEGRVQSGRYVYFATPSNWAMGTITKPGNGRDILGPKKPEGYDGAALLSSKPIQTQAAAQVNNLMSNQQSQSKAPEFFPIVKATEPKESKK